MAGTLSRLRFYLSCDLSPLEVDYIPSIPDYPEYPRDIGLTFFRDTYKSALGSNYWTYFRGTSSYWNMQWTDVSDDAQATMGLIIGSSIGYSPHVVIWESQGIDTISLASLLASVVPVGTFFTESDAWAPQETQYGLWSFKIAWRNGKLNGTQ